MSEVKHQILSGKALAVVYECRFSEPLPHTTYRQQSEIYPALSSLYILLWVKQHFFLRASG